ncbi:MAG: type II toxin-antitoxin system VapC family toxin [Candidatus Aenigmarchaeota archaeon]|nr:type II toxin-antitoxin system VapC family toxin [Candidatus Aenigmarchaeota archaeon]
MKCLDSDFLVAVLRGDASAVPFMEKLDQEGGAATTAITAYELLFGARLSKKFQETDEVRKLIGKLDILPFDEKVAEKASEIHASLKERGQEIGIKDMFIAAIALSHGSVVVTRNTKDFSRVAGLATEKW